MVLHPRPGSAPDGVDHEITSLTAADDVSALAERIYGDRLEIRSDRLHVLHPTAVWRRGDGALFTLKINRHTPKSAHDFFVLNLTRARADAVVVTGKILRDEPDLTLDLQGPRRVPEALRAWRRERLGKQDPPIALVLTSGRGLDLAHPLFHAETRPVVFTSPSGRRRIGRGRGTGVEVFSIDRPDLRSALSFLYKERHATTISIEAGPSTSLSLYESPISVCEILLSVYEAPHLDERVRGGVFVEPKRLFAFFERPTDPYHARAMSGPWSFSRYLRRPLGSP